MTLQDPEMPRSQVLITTSTELQYLLSRVKFYTHTAILLLLSAKALFLPDRVLLI